MSQTIYDLARAIENDTEESATLRAIARVAITRCQQRRRSTRRERNVLKKQKKDFAVMDAIAHSTLQFENVTVEQLRGNRRTAKLCSIRFRFMARSVREGISASQVGRYLNRDHATVLSGLRRLEK